MTVFLQNGNIILSFKKDTKLIPKQYNTMSQHIEMKVLYTGGLAQLGEHLPYKQRVGGSIPSSSTITYSAGVAQLVEQLTCNQ